MPTQPNNQRPRDPGTIPHLDYSDSVVILRSGNALLSEWIYRILSSWGYNPMGFQPPSEAVDEVVAALEAHRRILQVWDSPHNPSEKLQTIAEILSEGEHHELPSFP